MGKIIGGIAAVIIGFIGLTVIFGSWYTIDDGERGVILRNGAVIGTAGPGLGFKTPWIEDVEYISVRDDTKIYGELDNSFEAYSRDQQIADLKVSVNYRVPADRVAEVYTQYGTTDNMVARLLDRQVYEKVKTVFGQFNAVTAIQERSRLNQQVNEAIVKAISDEPLIVTSVQIEDISFSEAYNASIEERMKAEVEVLKLKQQLEQEKVNAEIKVTQANAEADAVRARAMAQAEATELQGNAEAKAIEARGKALRDNPTLVELVQAERWNGQLPSTMVPSGTVPFMDIR